MVKRVLITGAAGFIGSNMIKRCADEGWSVNGIDDLSNGSLMYVDHKLRNDIVIGDFVNSLIIGNHLRNQHFDAVIHLAALPRVSYSVKEPIKTNDINVTKTLQLMDNCRGNIDRFVFASSSSIYGGAEVLPTPESCLPNPQSPYGLQKLIIEGYLKLWNKHYNMDSVALRFFNVFGRNQLDSSPYATAVTAWLSAIRRDQPMRSDGDGSQTRDMCHVDNVTEACVLAIKHPHKLNAEMFNIACGESVSNNEILKSLQKRYPDAKKFDAPWRPGDVMHTLANVSKAKEEFGYIPIIKFWDGLEDTIKWTENLSIA